jgi:hypothetical protein
MARFTNSDGLTRRYDGQDIEKTEEYQVVDIGGGIKQLVVDFSYDALPGFDADASGGSTPDSFSDAIPFIPAGSTVLDAVLLVTTAFAGGTSYTVGFHQQNGTAIDTDGVYTASALPLSAINAAGAVVSPDGVDVVKTSGTFDGAAVDTANKGYLKVTASGTFTAGKARMVLTYVEAAPA